MFKVTLYIPTCNYGKYLSQAIKSVLAQTLKSWELIIINDGSTDNTREVLSEYENYSHIHVVHQENRGLAVSNNIALRLAKGEYVMRLDGDDYLDENALLILANALESNPEVGLVYPDYYRVNEEGEIVELERREKLSDDTQLFDMPAHGACTMIRKSCLLELGGYNENFRCQDGYDFWIRFIQKYKPFNVNMPLFYYRQHAHSLTANKAKILDTRRQLKRDFVKKNFGERIPKVLALIPTQKTSSFGENFAMRSLVGKPLIDYTLQEVFKTNLLDKVVVTSDDEMVLDYMGKYPQVMTIKRPAYLAKSNTRIEPTVLFVLQHLYENVHYEPDVVMLLYPHTPLRKFYHIEKAIDTMLIFDVSSVISVYEDLKVHYQHSNEGLEPLFKRRKLRLEREALYEENGAIYLSKKSAISDVNFLSERLGHIIMLPEQSIKLENEFHFWLAEKIIEEWQQL